MSTKTLNNDLVLNYIKDNLENSSFVSKIKDLVASNSNDSFDIPEWHKEHVMEVIKNEDSEEYVSDSEFFNLIN